MWTVNGNTEPGLQVCRPPVALAVSVEGAQYVRRLSGVEAGIEYGVPRTRSRFRLLFRTGGGRRPLEYL